MTKNVTPRGVVSLVCLLTVGGDENCRLVRVRVVCLPLTAGGDENRHHMRTPATRLPEDVRARRKCHFTGCGVADLPPDTGSDENCHLVRARAIRLPECVVARRKCHAKKLAVGCQRCCNWLCYRHGDALAHQLVGTLHRSAGADHLDDEKCRAEILDIIFLRWDVAKRQKLSCDGVAGPSFASMK